MTLRCHLAVCLALLMVPGSWHLPDDLKRPAVSPEQVKTIIEETCAYLGMPKTDYRFPNRPSNRGSIDRFLHCKRELERLMDGETKRYPPEFLWAARVCGSRCNETHLTYIIDALARGSQDDEWSDRLVDVIVTVAMRDALNLYEFMSRLVSYAQVDFWHANSKNGLFREGHTIFDIAGDLYTVHQDRAEVGFHHYRKWVELRKVYRCHPRVVLGVVNYFQQYEIMVDQHSLPVHYYGMFDVICSPDRKRWSDVMFFRVMDALVEMKVNVEKAVMIAQVGAMAFRSAVSDKSRNMADTVRIVAKRLSGCDDVDCMRAEKNAIVEAVANKRKEEIDRWTREHPGELATPPGAAATPQETAAYPGPAQGLDAINAAQRQIRASYQFPPENTRHSTAGPQEHRESFQSPPQNTAHSTPGPPEIIGSFQYPSANTRHSTAGKPEIINQS